MSGPVPWRRCEDRRHRDTRAGGDHRPRPRADSDAGRTLARGSADAADSGRDHRRHAARGPFPRAAAQALGRLRDGLNTFYDIELALAEGDMSTGVDLRRVRRASLVHGDAGGPGRAGGLGRRQLASDLLVAHARGQGDRRRRRLSAQRPLEICELLRPLRLGAARRPGRGSRRRRRTGASSSCRGRTTRPSTPGRSPACRAPAAGT